MCSIIIFYLTNKKRNAAAEGIPFQVYVQSVTLTSFAVFAQEFFHPTGGVYQFLFSGKERMTVGTDFHV